ncbi:hypothetical protein R50072_21570 [Simiduia litorea]
MIDFVPLSMTATVGISMGIIFYGGLYVTVTQGLNSPRPALWFSVSFLLRMCFVLLALYFINDGHWQTIVAFLTGFLVTGAIFQLLKGMQTQVASASLKSVPIKSISVRKQ